MSVSERLVVELTPARIEMEPGGSPVEVTVTLQNLTDVVEQYTVELTGLDPEWYTAPVASVGLFPQDRDQVRISLHPPKRPGVKAGTYPFQVIVRARDGRNERVIEGILDLRGYAAYRVDLTPRRQTARGKGAFRLQVANTGTADVRLGLDGHDAEEQGRVRFGRSAEASVTAGAKSELPVIFQPKSRPWVGPERSYDFVISVRPLDARGEPQQVSGQFTHRPLFRTLPIWGILKILAVLLVIFLAVILFFGTGIAEELGHRTQVAGSQLCGALYRVPVVGSGCPQPNRAPEPVANCEFAAGFKELHDAEGQLVGACTTNVRYDEFGNGLQYTEKGVLFWLKGSNTSYFLIDDSVYGLIRGKIQLVDGSGRQ
jgi:hypothetical protein